MTLPLHEHPASIAMEVERRMRMRYSHNLIRNEDGSYFAQIIEFPGCMTEGDTPAQALEMLDDAMRTWLCGRLEDRLDIPDPANDEALSGKFIVRVPKSMHRDLAERAERENVSLNAWVNAVLARNLGSSAASVSRKK